VELGNISSGLSRTFNCGQRTWFKLLLMVRNSYLYALIMADVGGLWVLVQFSSSIIPLAVGSDLADGYLYTTMASYELTS